MSERRSRGGLWVAILVLTVAALLATIMNFADWGEVRDLQRRVGQLESERR